MCEFAKEMNIQAREKLEAALQIVEKSQQEASPFYGLVSDEVPHCYLTDDEDLTGVTVVLFEASAIRVEVNQALLSVDTETLAKVLRNKYFLSNNATTRVRHPKDLKIKRDVELSDTLKHVLALRNLHDVLDKKFNGNSSIVAERLKLHDVFLELLTKIDLEELLYENMEALGGLVDKALGPNAAMVPSDRTWWRDLPEFIERLLYEETRTISDVAGIRKLRSALIGAGALETALNEARSLAYTNATDGQKPGV